MAPPILVVVLMAACEPQLRPADTAGTGGVGGASGPVLHVPDAAPQNEPPFTRDSPACAEQKFAAELVPLDLYLLMDASDSMGATVIGGAAGMTKWNAVRDAIETFIRDPRSAGLGVGLQYFPGPSAPQTCVTSADCGTFGPCLYRGVCAGTGTGGKPAKACLGDDECGAGGVCEPDGRCSVTPVPCRKIGAPCDQTFGMCLPAPDGICKGWLTSNMQCSVNDYAKPAVPVGDLPTAVAELHDSLIQRKPDGRTPLAAAVSGAVVYLQDRAAKNPDRRVAIVLATDGLPTACIPQDAAGIAALLAGAARQKPGIPTFVIGVFSAAEQKPAAPAVDALAAGGGTGAAIIVNPGQDLRDKFLAALNQVRVAALPCEFPIPTTMPGETIDVSKVNLAFLPASGDVAVVGHVAGPARCNPVLGGWYYDVDPAQGTPSRIVLCGLTCQGFKSDTAAKAEIRYGCKTKLIE